MATSSNIRHLSAKKPASNLAEKPKEFGESWTRDKVAYGHCEIPNISQRVSTKKYPDKERN